MLVKSSMCFFNVGRFYYFTYYTNRKMVFVRKKDSGTFILCYFYLFGMLDKYAPYIIAPYSQYVL